MDKNARRVKRRRDDLIVSIASLGPWVEENDEIEGGPAFCFFCGISDNTTDTHDDGCLYVSLAEEALQITDGRNSVKSLPGRGRNRRKKSREKQLRRERKQRRECEVTMPTTSLGGAP